MQIIYDVILKLSTVTEIRMLVSGNQDEDRLVIVFSCYGDHGNYQYCGVPDCLSITNDMCGKTNKLKSFDILARTQLGNHKVCVKALKSCSLFASMLDRNEDQSGV